MYCFHLFGVGQLCCFFLFAADICHQLSTCRAGCGSGRRCAPAVERRRRGRWDQSCVWRQTHMIHATLARRRWENINTEELPGLNVRSAVNRRPRQGAPGLLLLLLSAGRTWRPRGDSGQTLTWQTRTAPVPTHRVYFASPQTKITQISLEFEQECETLGLHDMRKTCDIWTNSKTTENIISILRQFHLNNSQHPLNHPLNETSLHGRRAPNIKGFIWLVKGINWFIRSAKCFKH